MRDFFPVEEDLLGPIYAGPETPEDKRKKAPAKAKAKAKAKGKGKDGQLLEEIEVGRGTGAEVRRYRQGSVCHS